jgi:hypothetical protein
MEKDICTNSDREVFELEISEDEKIYASDLFVGFFGQICLILPHFRDFHISG